MADHLSVNGAGLNAAAFSSADIADTLAAADTSGDVPGAKPSQAGVAAMDAALAALRGRGARQAGGQGAGLHIGNALYTHTNDSAAASITRTI